MFKECSFYQSYIWGHDILLLSYGCRLNDTQILTKWNKYINGCICLTEWHKQLFIEKYPILSNKIHIINNGIDINSFNKTNRTNKIKNKFIYSSRPDRGLNTLLQLWPKILQEIPDATLYISTYGVFPSNSDEIILKNIIDTTNSIHYLGNLQVDKLYNELSSSEYWLYPTHWPETSCITALEMLMSEVICLYYPVAGLPYTINKYGIQVTNGTEISTIVNLNEEQKIILRENGRLYAESCSWKNRTVLWTNLIFNTSDKTIIYTSRYFIEVIEDYCLGLSQKYNIELSSDDDYIIKMKPSKIIFIETVNSNKYNMFKEHNLSCEFGLLNLEPLNLEYRIKTLINTYNTYKIKIYDYSLSNIKLLKQNLIDNVEILPYIHTNDETQYLKHIHQHTNKIYDFGILSGCGAPNNSINELGPKRKKLVEFLFEKGFTVNIIKAWKKERDVELAKCNIILNIHGQLLQNNIWYNSNIFEHLRCDRLLNAGFTILSEESYCLDTNFCNQYSNLHIIDYMDFFKEETYSTFSLSIK